MKCEIGEYLSLQSRTRGVEIRASTRLVALAALTASVHSEALYHASTYFKLQVSTIMPALLTPLQDVEIPELDHQ